jgi:hypothetical protein
MNDYVIYSHPILDEVENKMYVEFVRDNNIVDDLNYEIILVK